MYSCIFIIVILCECNSSEVVASIAFIFGRVIGNDKKTFTLPQALLASKHVYDYIVNRSNEMMS